MIYAPPGSGYATPQDEESELPDSYIPMMEYPGTMRPGRTPENMPYHDLPIGDDDPDPVPWPHFQQIEWHHKWEPPHPHPIPMEQFIEMHGRWATPEMEAEMRAGIRRDVRERQELEQETKDAQGKETIITDDDDDDDDDLTGLMAIANAEEPVSLGDGVFGTLGSAADEAITAKATQPPTEEDLQRQLEQQREFEAKQQQQQQQQQQQTDDDEEEDDDLDNFLLDLGLDVDMDDDGDDEEDDATADDNKPTKPTLSTSTKDDDSPAFSILDQDDVEYDYDDDDDDDDDDDGGSITMKRGPTSPKGPTRSPGAATVLEVDDDDDTLIDLGVDDDDDDDDGPTVPLDSLEADADALGGEEDLFDGDGGFDFDDFGGGGDGW